MNKLMKQRKAEKREFTQGARKYMKRWLKRCERQQGKKMCR